MLRKFLWIAVLSLTLPGLALARTERIRISMAARPWRIELSTSGYFLAKDQPVVRGSMLVFHGYPDGRLIAIPQEQVARIDQPGALPAPADIAHVAASRLSTPLQPGEVRVIGDTGGGSGAVAGNAYGGSVSPSAVGSAGTSAADPGRLGIDALVFRGDTTVPMAGGGAGASGYGSTAGGMVLNPTLAGRGTLNPTLVNPGVATGTGTTTLGPNGFPTTVGSEPVNPNGFPATTTTGSESGTQPINPNGFPAMTTTGSESGIQPVGPNGFPTLTSQPTAGTGRSTTQPRSPSSR